MKPDMQQQGFTLLEAMIALLLLIIAILPMFTMQTTAIRGNSSANQLTIASNHALSQIEQILSWPANDARLVPGGNVIIDGQTIAWVGAARMDASVVPQRIGTDLQINVTWNEADRQRQITMFITK